jgi:hypothetical protein
VVPTRVCHGNGHAFSRTFCEKPLILLILIQYITGIMIEEKSITHLFGPAYIESSTQESLL